NVSSRSGAISKLHRVAPWLALALLVILGGEFVSASIERVLGLHRYADMTPQALLAIVAARSAAELGLALLGVYAILHAPLTSIGLRLPKVGGLALGVAIGLGTALIFPRLVHALRLQSSYNLQYAAYIMSHATGLIAAASILVYVFCVPIVEEIVFRGIVLEGLINLTNGVVAVVVSAVIFAGMHVVGGVAQVTVAFTSGLVIGWLYLRTRSIVPTSAAHIIYDAVAFYPVILLMLRAKHF
ncbi:MAG: type II CAAX endopeptidase family protein, partial [Candidatus Cybelea sp.]